MQVKIEIVGFNVDCRVHSLLKKIINEAFQSHQIHNIHMTKFTEASKNIMPTGVVFKAKLLFHRINHSICYSIRMNSWKLTKTTNKLYTRWDNQTCKPTCRNIVNVCLSKKIYLSCASQQTFGSIFCVRALLNYSVT